MKLFKKTFSMYVLLSILGVVCIGLGCGISVFELSEYKVADYRTSPADPSLPQLKSEVVTLEAPLSGSELFKLDATYWTINGYDIQYDNTLTDKVIIEITAPEDFYSISLQKADMQQENYYYLECTVDEFALMRFSLGLAKQGYIPDNYPPAEVTLIMSETQAKNFKLNEMRDKSNALEQSYQEEIRMQQEHYNEQLNEVHAQYNEQLQMTQEQHSEQIQSINQQHEEQLQAVREQYEEQLQAVHEQYEEQLMLKEEKIHNLQQQLNDVRSSLQ